MSSCKEEEEESCREVEIFPGEEGRPIYTNSCG